jgi:branched-chain amino acid transport system substrate-binding protein
MKRKTITLVSTLISVLMIVAMLVSFGCTPSAPQGGGSTLKVGMIAWLGFPIGLDMVHSVEIMADMDNKAGGLNIGGQKYNVQVITYDVKNDQATATAATNRLIFEDKVKFILSDGIFFDACLPTTEQNKIVVSAITPSPEIFNPSYKYSFMTCFNWSMQTSGMGWLASKYPDKKSIFVAYPDAFSGHAQEPSVKAAAAAFGKQYTEEFYPATSQDLSSLGTKVKNANPDIFMAVGGGPVSDGLAFKAVSQAGYKGMLFSTTTTPYGTLSQLVPAQVLEGYISTAWPVEFDPAISQPAKDFKAAWIAKYGKWEGPEIQGGAAYSFLRAALMKVGAIDSEKVAAEVNANGLKYDGPCGEGQMGPRPDLKNNRYVDSIVALPVKQIKDGKPVQIDTINLDNSIKYFKQVFK